MVRAPELIGGEWLDAVPRPIRESGGKVFLLDFFTFGCINCMNNLPMLTRLQARYGDRLTILGVHSGKFAYEKDAEAVRKAVERLGITYPVINDPKGTLVDQYAVKAWPTMVLIDTRGYITAEFRGEGQGVAIDLALQRLGLVPRTVTAARPARQPQLRFPEAVVCSEAGFLVANSGAGDVREYTKSGRLHQVFSPFKHPSALAMEGQMLYVADREAGTVCRIDLQSGERRELLAQLRSPSALLVGEQTLTVAEAGAHMITVYNKARLTPLQRFGNRFEALRDGIGEASQLAQPMGMARCDDGRIWFVDAESSSLRVIENDTVTTAVGEGLFTFGDSDSAPVRLQHPQGIACGRIGDGCGGGRVFIADTYNGKLKVFYPLGGRMMTLMENLNEPAGLCKEGCSLYIVESGAHRILKFDLSSMRADTIIS